MGDSYESSRESCSLTCKQMIILSAQSEQLGHFARLGHRSPSRKPAYPQEYESPTLSLSAEAKFLTFMNLILSVGQDELLASVKFLKLTLRDLIGRMSIR